MATIKTSIQLQDNMTSVIKNISAALGASINAFEALEGASTNAISMKSIESARMSLGRLTNDIQMMESGLESSNNSQVKFNRSISQGSMEMGDLTNNVIGLVSAYASLQGLKNAMDLSDEMATSISRIDMMNDGLQTTAELQQMIFNSAQRSLAPYQDTVDIVAALGNRAKDAFSNNQETIQFAENLAKMFSIAGASQQEMTSASLQLTQALGSGVLRGEELNAVFEAAPNIIQAIADSLDVNIGQIREMASEGKLTASVVKNAMLEATDEVNKKFASMPTTFGDVFTKFRNNALKNFEPVLKKMTEISSSERFNNFFNGLSQSLSMVSYLALNALNVLSSVGGFVADNWNVLGPIIIGVTSALTAMGTAMLIAKGYTMIATAAMWAFNAALWANPIGIVIAAVTLLTVALYLGVAAVNNLTGSTVNATGIMFSVFSGLFAFLYNSVATLWNLFASLAEFVGNVFLNPVYSVRKLFFNLMETAINLSESMIGSFDSAATNLANLFVGAANTAISAINAVANALSQIPGIEIGTIGKIGNIKSVSANLTNLKTKMADFIGPPPSSYVSLNKMSYKSLPDAFVNGYSTGSSFSNKITSMPQTVSTGLEDLLKSINEGIGGVGEDGKETSKNTKKAADNAGIVAEDLKYLRDLSEREAINRFTSASIKVDMNNNLQVDSVTDIDGIIDRFGEKVEETTKNLAFGGDI